MHNLLYKAKSVTKVCCLMIATVFFSTGCTLSQLDAVNNSLEAMNDSLSRSKPAGGFTSSSDRDQAAFDALIAGAKEAIKPDTPTPPSSTREVTMSQYLDLRERGYACIETTSPEGYLRFRCAN